MSVNLNALKQYKNVDLRSAVETASPKELISMLVDGALTAMAKAMGAIERKEISARTQQLNKANDIILGLKDFLNHEKGGEIATNLDALYDYMIRTLLQANRTNDAAKVQEVMTLMLQIKSGWNGMEVPAA
ncbi:flagellar export chaperone FliS [Neptunomonas qingdaonensis]|uniref:Flagellar secretion chaperone FliS n=1 Tax=Neptunomonas qingdaonensis TaxID=1045558 RepID=A0A1I2N2V5_9GAMM|nr:flagellar export chaperone FliS [Neptunomonas qingdaonensis]SFF97430.1 flagellar protein FliS [Neptunomonas qingdaonensis]